MRDGEVRAYLRSLVIDREILDGHVAVDVKGLSSHAELGWTLEAAVWVSRLCDSGRLGDEPCISTE
jgi:hypothetical protein